MRDRAEGIPETSKGGDAASPRSFAKRLWRRVVELWIFLTILTFFIIRVLGSHTAQGILGRLSHHHTL